MREVMDVGERVKSHIAEGLVGHCKDFGGHWEDMTLAYFLKMRLYCWDGGQEQN